MCEEKKCKVDAFSQCDVQNELAEAKLAGGMVVEGVKPFDALTTTLDACRKMEIMNLEETASFLRISKSKLYNHVKYRYIPFLRIGGKIVFIRSLLEKWVLRQTVVPDFRMFQSCSADCGVSA